MEWIPGDKPCPNGAMPTITLTYELERLKLECLAKAREMTRDPRRPEASTAPHLSDDEKEFARELYNEIVALGALPW